MVAVAEQPPKDVEFSLGAAGLSDRQACPDTGLTISLRYSHSITDDAALRKILRAQAHPRPGERYMSRRL